MMTRLDFELIASVLRDVRQNAQDDDNYDSWWHTEYALTFADRLERTNLRFDRDRFLAAAQRDGTKVIT